MYVVHCSVWTYRGDPDGLVARYEAMIAEIPLEAMDFAACIRTPDGFQALLARHGLAVPASLTDHPVVAAFAGGRRVES